MFPFIFAAIAVGSAAYGAITGINGVSDMSEAKGIVEAAKKSYESAFDQSG